MHFNNLIKDIRAIEILTYRPAKNVIENYYSLSIIVKFNFLLYKCMTLGFLV